MTIVTFTFCNVDGGFHNHGVWGQKSTGVPTGSRGSGDEVSQNPERV